MLRASVELESSSAAVSLVQFQQEHAEELTTRSYGRRSLLIIPDDDILRLRELKLTYEFSFGS
jgi:chorismate-pyruvate lyase